MILENKTAEIVDFNLPRKLNSFKKFFVYGTCGFGAYCNFSDKTSILSNSAVNVSQVTAPLECIYFNVT